MHTKRVQNQHIEILNPTWYTQVKWLNVDYLITSRIGKDAMDFQLMRYIKMTNDKEAREIEFRTMMVIAALW